MANAAPTARPTPTSAHSRTQLAQQGIRALPLNLAQNQQVPRNADLVVLASPQAALSPLVGEGAHRYLDRRRRQFPVADRARRRRPRPRAAGAGTGRARAAGRAGGRRRGQPRHRRSAHAGGERIPAARDHARLPGECAVPASRSRSPPSAARHGRSRRSSAAARRAGTRSRRSIPTQASTIKYDASLGELRGPLDFGFALSRLSPSPDKSEQRAVVIGDGDFLSNSFLGNGGNRAFGAARVRLAAGRRCADRAATARRAGSRDPLTQADLGIVTWVFLIAVAAAAADRRRRDRRGRRRRR